MGCRFHRDSLACGTQENDSDIPPGMEGCLKKLVLKAEAMGFGDSEKGRLGAGGTLWEKNRARRAQLKANARILSTAGGSKN